MVGCLSGMRGRTGNSCNTRICSFLSPPPPISTHYLSLFISLSLSLSLSLVLSLLPSHSYPSSVTPVPHLSLPLILMLAPLPHPSAWESPHSGTLWEDPQPGAHITRLLLEKRQNCCVWRSRTSPYCLLKSRASERLLEEAPPHFQKPWT